IAIKGRGSQGNIITKYPIKKITLKSKGVSTLSGRKIWFDETLKRLNVDSRGKYLGEFDGEDKLLTVMADGTYALSSFDLSNHFDDQLIRIEKFNPQQVYNAVHQDGKSGVYYVKRFQFEDIAIGKRISIINDESGSKLILLTPTASPLVRVDVLKGKSQTPDSSEQNLADIVDVKGMRAQGNRLTPHEVTGITLLTAEEPLVDSAEGEDGGATTAQPIGATRTQAEETKSDVRGSGPDRSGDEPVGETAKQTKADETQNSNGPVDFEITNPDDIQIDDKGQMGLF